MTWDDDGIVRCGLSSMGSPFPHRLESLRMADSPPIGPDTPPIAPVWAVLTMVGLLLRYLSWILRSKRNSLPFAGTFEASQTAWARSMPMCAKSTPVCATSTRAFLKLIPASPRRFGEWKRPCARRFEKTVSPRAGTSTSSPESLRDDIRIIAEGFVALDAKVERIRDSR